jgi:hypothetical protein
VEEVTDSGGPGVTLVKGSRAILPVDLEGDGDIDVLFTNLSDTPDLLRNDGAVGGWLQVRLEGLSSNRDGIGARVTIEAAGRRQFREIRRTYLFEGSTLPIAHFGLGAARTVERIDVRWPSGRTSVMQQVEANRRITIREPAAD